MWLKKKQQTSKMKIALITKKAPLKRFKKKKKLFNYGTGMQIEKINREQQNDVWF